MVLLRSQIKTKNFLNKSNKSKNWAEILYVYVLLQVNVKKAIEMLIFD